MRKGDKIFIEGNYQFNAYYSGRSVQRFWHYTKLLEAQNALQISSTDTILDAGCGSGLLAWFIAQHDPLQVWGVDANESAIDFCNTRFQRPNLRFTQAVIDELPFPDNSFNKIAFLEVIEHLSIEQGLVVLRKFHSLLQPGGTLVISTPNKNSAWPLIEKLLDRFNLVPKLSGEQHEYLYTGPRLTQLAKEAGFECVSQKTINFLSPWAAAISWKLGLGLHAMEVRSGCRIGSLLLYAFRKKA